MEPMQTHLSIPSPKAILDKALEVLGIGKIEPPKEGSSPLPPASVSAEAMPKRPLGRTGERVSIIGLGGAHIGKQKDESESIRIIRTAIDWGVTFLDNCWDYNDGQSEARMGKAMDARRRRRAALRRR